MGKCIIKNHEDFNEPIPGSERSPKKGGEILHDAEKKLEKVDTNAPPSFRFKNWKDRFVMSPAELSQYMIDLRDYIAESAQYVREQQGVLEAANTKKAPISVAVVVNNNHPPSVGEAA